MKAPLAIRGFAAVARRDLVDRRALWPAAWILGMVPPLTVFLPAFQHHDPIVVRDLLAVCAAGLLMIGSLIGIGATALGSDYLNGRIAFYLARPIHPASLWLGKITAGALTVIGAGLTVLLPTLLIGGRPWASLDAFFPSGSGSASTPLWGMPVRFSNLRWSTSALSVWTSNPSLTMLIFCGLLLAATAHLLGITFGLRNRWTLGDAVVLGGIALCTLGISANFTTFQADRAQAELVLALTSAIVLAGTLGGWAQIRWGGTDPVRAHRSQSLLLWTFGVLALLPATHQAWQLNRTGPEDLDQLVGSHLAPKGPWTVVNGMQVDTGYRPTFAWNSESAESIWLGVSHWNPETPIFSGDGSSLLWPKCPGSGGPCQLHLVRFDDDANRKPQELGIRAVVNFDRFQRRLAINYDGTQLAVAKDHQIRFFRLPVGVPTHTVELPESYSIDILDFDHETKGLRIQASLSPPSKRFAKKFAQKLFTLDPTTAGMAPVEVAELASFSTFLPGGRWIRSRGREEPLTLVDARSGERFPLPNRNGRRIQFFSVLSDQRIAMVASPPRTAPDRQSDWIIFDSNRIDSGDPLNRFSLGTSFIMLGGEVAPGKLLVGRLTGAPEPHPGPLNFRTFREHFFGSAEHWQTAVIDLDRGKIVRTFDGYLPFRCSPLASCSSPAGTLGSNWLMDYRGRPSRLDLVSGEITPLMEGKSPRGRS